MSKIIKVRETTSRNNKKESVIHEAIKEFINDNEESAEMFDPSDYESIPVMMRLEKREVAQLDHLATRWHKTRSSLACEMLEEMINLVMRQVYKDKNTDEYLKFTNELVNEFDKKRKKKKGKEKQKEG